ncbi:MAG: pentapeptide repeat-containing protein [Acidimicrobiia bacterium]
MTDQSNYHGQDLRGESFAGANLDGADFTEADVRAVDFAKASLVDADFTNARIGVKPLTGVLILVGAMLVSIAAGVVVGLLADGMEQRITSSEWQDLLGGILLLALIVLFFYMLLKHGIVRALKIFLVVVIIAVAVDFIVVEIFGEPRYRDGLPVIGLILMFGPAAVAGIMGRIVGGVFGGWAIAVVSVIGGLAAGRVNGGLAAIVVTVVLMLVAKRALKADDRDLLSRRLAQRIMARRGTNFTGADLTRANFAGTALTQADLSEAVLDGAVWDEGKGPLAVETN